jgi:hypothetical protein
MSARSRSAQAVPSTSAKGQEGQIRRVTVEGLDKRLSMYKQLDSNSLKVITICDVAAYVRTWTD